jgi:hypothetical protein
LALSIIAALLGLLAACGSGDGIPGDAELAYVGPFELEVWADLEPGPEVIATLRYADPVHIVGRRRRFAQIVTGSGIHGWTDGWMLLTPAELDRMTRLAERAAALPSQGATTVYEPWNVHTAARRNSPSFFQLTPGVMADVVSRRVEPRESYEPPAAPDLMFLKPSYFQPLDPPDFPGGADAWALVRLPDGRAGWTISQPLVMAIPDEVAQYSEGHQITSYFSLGEVTDGGVRKHHWLWTTLSPRLAPYDFDGFRVFVWSTSRHRYETAYRERNLVGYYPVEIFTPAGDVRSDPNTPSFSIVVRGEDGSLYRRAYSFSGYRVGLISEGPWQPPPEPETSTEELADSEEQSQGLLHSIRSTVGGWFR